MKALLALAKVTYKEYRFTWWGIVSFNILVFILATGARTVGGDEQSQLYYSIAFDVTFFLSLILVLFTLAFSLPRDLKEKKVHTILVRPLRPVQIMLGRWTGSLALVLGQWMVVALALLVLIGAGWAPLPPQSYQSYYPQGIDVEGSFHSEKTTVYWTQRPQMDWRLEFKSPTSPLLDSRELRSGLPLLSPLKRAHSPTLRFDSIEVLKGEKAHLKMVLHVKVQGSKVELPLFHRTIEVESKKATYVTLPSYYLLFSGKWKLSLYQENLGESLRLRRETPTLLLPASLYRRNHSAEDPPYLSRRFTPTSYRGAEEEQGAFAMRGAKMIWHFHRLPNQSRLAFEWTPLLKLANSNSRARVGVGKNPRKITRWKEVEIFDNQDKVIEFDRKGARELYFVMEWIDDDNNLGADLSRSKTGRPQNGVILRGEEVHPLWAAGKLFFLYFLKLALVAMIAGVAGIVLSPYITLFFSLSVYLCGHSLASIRSFSEKLMSPGEKGGHGHGHSHGLHGGEASSGGEVTAGDEYLSQFLDYFTTYFPDFSRFDFLTPYLQGHFLPPSLLGQNGYYFVLFFVPLFFLAVLFFFRKEYP